MSGLLIELDMATAAAKSFNPAPQIDRLEAFAATATQYCAGMELRRRIALAVP